MLEPKGILDPELFVPAGQMRNSIEYWSRLMPWVSDRFFLVGPRSYERLSELCGTPPGVTGIPAPEIWRIIGAVRATGIASLIVDRNYRSVLAHTDRCVVLEKGRVVLEGKSVELAEAPEKLARYLGV